MTADRLLAAVAAVAVTALVACGGSDKKSSPTTIASPLTTTRAVDTNFTGAGSGEFCDLAKTLNNPTGTPPNASTAQIRAELESGDRDIRRAVDAAPAEIKPDVQTIATGYSSLMAALSQADYDLSKVSPDALAAFQTPEFSYSAARFRAYLTQVCHITK